MTVERGTHLGEDLEVESMKCMWGLADISVISVGVHEWDQPVVNQDTGAGRSDDEGR